MGMLYGAHSKKYPIHNIEAIQRHYTKRMIVVGMNDLDYTGMVDCTLLDCLSIYIYIDEWEGTS